MIHEYNNIAKLLVFFTIVLLLSSSWIRRCKILECWNCIICNILIIYYSASIIIGTSLILSPNYKIILWHVNKTIIRLPYTKLSEQKWHVTSCDTDRNPFDFNSRFLQARRRTVIIIIIVYDRIIINLIKYLPLWNIILGDIDCIEAVDNGGICLY